MRDKIIIAASCSTCLYHREELWPGMRLMVHSSKIDEVNATLVDTET